MRWSGELLTTLILDYSSGTSQPLTETALVEAQGLRRAGSGGVDFDCSGAISGTVAVDGVTGITTLNDHDDWSNLQLAFGHDAAGVGFVLDVQLDAFTDELRPLADERGFMPR